jgi:ATP-dependent RNA helicase RhlE
LCKYLDQHGFRVAAIHGNTSQGQRTRALADFKNGKITVLVATDIAARGLDIAQLPAVVNYDLPMVAQDYVHRIGRTGRAGAEGLALSLVSREEEGLLRDIRRLLKQDIAIEPIEGFEPTWNLRLDNLAPAVRKQGRNSGNGGRNNAKSGKPSHTRRPHAQRGKEGEHTAAKKQRRSWRDKVNSRKA